MFEIGTSLREARIRQGLELVEAEAATKIRGTYLAALEEERFGQLPAQTYVKGFLRSYSEFLGLDGQLYVDEYNSRYGGGEEEPVVRPRHGAAIHAQRRIESRALLAGLAGIAAVTVLVFVAWKWGGADPSPVPNLGSSAPTTTLQTTRRPAGPAPISVRIAATRGDSALKVRRNGPHGELLWRGTLQRGQSRRWTGRRLWLQVGSPVSVAVRVDGRVQKLPRRRTMLVTRGGVAPAPAV
ncbi:MAG: helix-turn-helix domain-containing protein [Actinobacteria bacterium]|nr:helix-turn-helix domain-containing protein [Actinomycetota bacterium]